MEVATPLVFFVNGQKVSLFMFVGVGLMPATRAGEGWGVGGKLLKEMFYLTTHSTHFYVRLYEKQLRHIGYSFRLAARAPQRITLWNTGWIGK